MIKALLQKLSIPRRHFHFPKMQPIGKELIHTICSTALVWQILFFYLPLICLIITSFTSYGVDGKIKSIDFTHFAPIMNFTYFKVIFNSLVLSLSTAVISLCIAFPLTYYIVFKTRKWKYLLLFLLLIPFWTNFLLHIYAWFFILEKNGLVNQFLLYIGLISTPLKILNTKFASLLLMVYYYLPFVALPIFSALERFNVSYFEASLTLGASRTKTFLRVVFPLIEKSLITGFFLVFIPAFGEFLIPEFMGGDKTYYVGNVISLFFLGERSAPSGIAFTALSISILLLCSAALYLMIKTLFHHLQGGAHDQ